MVTIKQRKAVVELGVNGGNISKAMKVAGYSPSACKRTEKLTGTVGFKELLDKVLPDSMLLAEHTKLLKQRQLNYFIFPNAMADEDIVANVNANGLDVIVIRSSDKGKMAFYSIDDANAKKSGLDMAYKLKGSYSAEKHEITIPKPLMDV